MKFLLFVILCFILYILYVNVGSSAVIAFLAGYCFLFICGVFVELYERYRNDRNYQQFEKWW